MSTRGFTGVHVDGVTKISYNHSDSYPSWLGRKFIEDVKALLDLPLDGLRDLARKVRLVDEGAKPTAADLKRFAKFANTTVSGQVAAKEYYVLLRELQGELPEQLRLGIMTDAREFATNGFYCEWGYLLDLDAEAVEIYESREWTTNSNGSAGKWADHPGAVGLVATFPLDKLPADGDELMRSLASAGVEAF